MFFRRRPLSTLEAKAKLGILAFATVAVVGDVCLTDVVDAGLWRAVKVTSALVFALAYALAAYYAAADEIGDGR